jgi:hypothetical protein
MADEPSDWDDPCIVYAWLRPKVMALRLGGAVVSVRTGANRQTDFSPADIKAAEAMLASYAAQCAAKNGDSKNRRHAIRFG